MLTKFLDPRNDVAFRAVFGTPKNQDILKHFLNDVIDFREGLPIVEVTLLNTHQLPKRKAGKLSVVDVLCEDEKKNLYLVEMQVRTKLPLKHVSDDTSQDDTDQVAQEVPYGTLKEVIFLDIYDGILFPQKEAYKSHHITLDRRTQEHDLKELSYTFLELGKFHLGLKDLKTPLECWCYFFKHAQDTRPEDVPIILHENPYVAKAYEALDSFSWSPEQLALYKAVEGLID